MFRRSVIAVGVVAVAGMVALWPGVAAASTTEGTVPILSGPGNCGNDNGGRQIGSVEYSLKGTKLSLGVNVKSPDLATRRGSWPVFIFDAPSCAPVSFLGPITTNQNGAGSARFSWTAPCSGGTFFVAIESIEDVFTDSLSFTLPSTC